MLACTFGVSSVSAALTPADATSSSSLARGSTTGEASALRASTEERVEALPRSTRPAPWRLIATPMAGGLRNTIRFEYEVPTGPDEMTPRSKELDDRGWGAALAATFVHGRFAITNILFLIPEVNSSQVVGNVLSASYGFPLFWRCSLVAGLGFTYHNVDTRLEDFEDTVTKEGVSATARFDEFKVRNDVFAPFPKLGLKIRIPIQHWYVTPYVSYLYEALKLKVASPGGRVYIPEPVDETKIIPPIDVDKWKHYHSFLVGLDIFLDFHYALQLRVKMHYNVSHELFTIRSIASAFFSRRFPLGLTAYFEYSQGIIHDNIYGFVGPSYMF
jgi:hypothetical protein